jgi:hypothetical protein
MSLFKSKKAKIICIVAVIVMVIVVGFIIWRLVFNDENDNSNSGSFTGDPLTCRHSMPCGVEAKPVIYLYPETSTEVQVQLTFDGQIIASHPAHQNTGWQVTAHPNGKILSEGQEYSYLFWEGAPSTPRTYDWSTGFVIKGADTREFLQSKLPELGLTPQEYNEFIVYWYPKMQNNPYNLIHFATPEEYDKYAKLTITPTPDAILRVFMVFKPLEQPITVQPQIFPEFTRQGFTVVEWGGSELE